MFPQTGLPAYYLRKKFPDCLLIAFMADLPIEDTPNRRVLGKCLRKLFNRIAEKLVTVADKLVVLNKNAAEVCAPETPYTVVEGGVNTEDASPNIISVAKREKIIVYSGKLIGYNGIMELMQSMNLVTCRNVKLHIYGDGPLKETISACAEKTDKIEYMGLVENDTMKRIQREAYLLINPRPVDDPIAMVTFPSKIFEYLISGTPVLTTRLNGFTNEYFDKMFFTESNAPAELACKIDEIMAMPFDALDSMAQNAKNFVMKEKNWSKQMQKIIEFIEKG